MRKRKKQVPQSNKPHLYDLLIENDIHYVDLGYKKYEIILAESPNNGIDECYGYMDELENLIVLDSNLTNEEAIGTLQHEIFHCILDLASQSHDDNPLRLDNEQVADLMSKGMMLVYKLNPKLFKILYV